MAPDGAEVFDHPLDLRVIRGIATDATGRIAISGRADIAQLKSTIQWFAP